MLSLSMIVRDEAERLERCLASVVGFVDEIIVVDTGSQDDSIATLPPPATRPWNLYGATGCWCWMGMNGCARRPGHPSRP